MALSPAWQAEPPVEPAWYALQVTPGRERRVAAALPRAAAAVSVTLEAVAVPLSWHARPVHPRTGPDRTVAVQVPRIPGYVLVRCVLTADLVAVFRQLPGVRRWVGDPTPIPPDDLTAWLDPLPPAPAALWPAGTWVDITAGPFQGVTGRVLDSSGTRVRVVVTLLGQDLTLDLPPTAVVAAS